MWLLVTVLCPWLSVLALPLDSDRCLGPWGTLSSSSAGRLALRWRRTVARSARFGDLVLLLELLLLFRRDLLPLLQLRLLDVDRLLRIYLLLSRLLAELVEDPLRERLLRGLLGLETDLLEGVCCPAAGLVGSGSSEFDTTGVRPGPSSSRSPRLTLAWGR